MKIVVICWLHTGDPDVQESQACPQTQQVGLLTSLIAGIIEHFNVH